VCQLRWKVVALAPQLVAHAAHCFAYRADLLARLGGARVDLLPDAVLDGPADFPGLLRHLLGVVLQRFPRALGSALCRAVLLHALVLL
jgi:hypothetical protein